MQRLVTATQMRGMDHEAIQVRGVPGYDLMTRAGHGVADAILNFFEEMEDAPVAVLAGRGNNGGDGFVAARHLKEKGTRPTVVLVGARPADLEGDAARAYAEWTEAGGTTLVATDGASWKRAARLLGEVEVVVDALLGTGSRGAPRGLLATAIRALVESEVKVAAVDIPSGADADDGTVADPCVHADLTVTLGLPKRGLYLYPARAFAGQVETVDLGFPADILEMGEGLRTYLPDPEDILGRLPRRRPDMHKGDRGRLLLVGGSAGLTGAVALAARAAVRAGAGLVTAAVPRGLQDVFAVKLTEAMTLGLPDTPDRALGPDALAAILAFQPGQLTALAVGPGLGRRSETRDLVRALISRARLPLVLDADGLQAFAGVPDLLAQRPPGVPLVLTPHPGEFAALTGEPVDAAAARPEAAARWARRLGAVVVLKGAPTLIADPSGEVVFLNPTGNEALASGGTGDVLTGFLAGYLAQGVPPVDAALAAVYIHGWAADSLVADWGSPHGLVAGDLIDIYPHAVGFLISPPEGDEDADYPVRTFVNRAPKPLT